MSSGLRFGHLKRASLASPSSVSKSSFSSIAGVKCAPRKTVIFKLVLPLPQICARHNLLCSPKRMIRVFLCSLVWVILIFLWYSYDPMITDLSAAWIVASSAPSSNTRYRSKWTYQAIVAGISTRRIVAVTAPSTFAKRISWPTGYEVIAHDVVFCL